MEGCVKHRTLSGKVRREQVRLGGQSRKSEIEIDESTSVTATRRPFIPRWRWRPRAPRRTRARAMAPRALASRGGSTAPGDASPPPGDAAFAARVAGDDAEDDALADALGRFEDLDARDRDAREAHDAAWDARLAAFRDRCAALELAMRDRHSGEASALLHVSAADRFASSSQASKNLLCTVQR